MTLRDSAVGHRRCGFAWRRTHTGRSTLRSVLPCESPESVCPFPTTCRLRFHGARGGPMQAIRVNNFLRLNPMHTGHHELDIVTDLVNHGITLMLPQTSSLLVEAR